MSIKKEQNREIRNRIKLQKEISENPDWCYCHELLGLESDFDPLMDDIIERSEPVDGFPYWNSTNFSINIYRCKRCNKKTGLSPGY